MTIIGLLLRSKDGRIALISLLMSVFGFYLWAPLVGAPPRTQLQRTSGTVAWAEKNKSGVRFGFEGDSRTFFYFSKGSMESSVYFDLTRAGFSVVSVLYDPNDMSGPIWAPNSDYDVYELVRDETPIRGYTQSDAA